MDSKFRRIAVLIVVLMVLTVGGVVVLTNRQLLQNTTGSAVLPGGAAADATASDAAGSAAVTGTAVSSQAVTYASGFAGADPARQQGTDLKAFQKDAAFFDTKKSDLEKELAAENANQLSFVAMSVAHDLRIMILDHENHVVTGIPFVVDLRDGESYRDENEDGVIAIGDLKAGDYAITLEPVKGYTVPQETKVTVKDKVEYTAIPDISLLVKTEAEIVAQNEDLEVNDAAEHADASEITGLQDLKGNGTLGVDVSKYNGDIDWDKVREAGISFVIIRAGYRGASSGVLVEDPKFQQNIKGALDAGLSVGIYFFTQAVNEAEAVEEASTALALSKDYHLALPVFIDSESTGGNGRADALTADERTAVCEAFCKTVENAGMSAGVYGGRNWLTGKLHAGSLENHTVWLAEYRGVPQYGGYYQLWQYTSRGSVDGIEGNVDLDVSYLPETGTISYK